MQWKKALILKLIISGVIVILSVACAESRQISTFEKMNVRRSTEAAERSAGEVNRYAGELKLRNDRLEELTNQLKRAADRLEQQAEIGEGRVQRWDKATLPPARGAVR